MKILVIATQRSGSTSFARAISKLLNIDFINEPFNDSFKSRNDSKTSFVVKTMIEQKSLSFYNNYIKDFDNIIFISRKSHEDVYRSLYYQKYIKDQSLPLNSWHTPYTPPDIEVKDDNLLGDIKKDFVKLHKLASDLNKKVIYYENIFTNDVGKFNDSIEQTNLNINRSYLKKELDTSKRYKRERPIMI